MVGRAPEPVASTGRTCGQGGMERPYDIVTFDCYGTLVDWEEGIANAFAEAAAADGLRLARREVLALHAAIEPQVQREGYRSYREVLEETARRIASRLGWSIDPARARFLPDSLPAWRPFPDTVPALERLAGAGYALGVLSNVDDALLAGTLGRIPVPFELLVTAEKVRAYKPDPAHFLEARRRVGARRWLHVARSRFHDVLPARGLGVPVVWINRGGETADDGAGRDEELHDLTELADRLVPPG